MKKDAVHDWLKITGRPPLLSEAEIITLTRIIQNPEEKERNRRTAVDKIVRHNLRMVVKVTIEFLRRRNIGTNDDRVSDYLQQGTLGLIRAAEKFDPSKGYKFTTYTYRWVRQRLGRYYYKNYSLIYIPENTLTGLLNGHTQGSTKELIEAAAQVVSIDSLDRTITQDSGLQVRLGDLVAETTAVW
jgi:RNA polymerase sigma factor (sigma-70 family)